MVLGAILFICGAAIEFIVFDSIMPVCIWLVVLGAILGDMEFMALVDMLFICDMPVLISLEAMPI